MKRITIGIGVLAVLAGLGWWGVASLVSQPVRENTIHSGATLGVPADPEASGSTGGNNHASKKHWENFEKPNAQVLKERLSDIQYSVTQEDGTEPAFKNAYWNETRPGIYVDIVSGEPLFSSRDKYKSGTGWPSFTTPLVPESIVYRKDRKFFQVRTEVRSKHADSHLGHVFDDGPTTREAADGAAPTGKRYCLNSAALRFIPAEDLEEEGYSQFNYLFDSEQK